MRLQVLVSTMNQNNKDLLQKMNIATDVIVVNQCDIDCFESFTYNNHEVIWINTSQRGLSKSRNMALSYASADICILADDDLRYYDGYEQIILEAFKRQKKADLISFNYERKNRPAKRKPNVNRKSPFYKSYPSVSIAFKLNKIIKNGLHFNELIGAGSNYGAGEESLFILEARKKGLKVYENSSYICTVDYATSTWFTGFDFKFYYDTGIYLGIAYRKLAWFYSFYFLLQSRKLSNLKLTDVYLQMRNGIRDFKKL